MTDKNWNTRVLPMDEIVRSWEKRTSGHTPEFISPNSSLGADDRLYSEFTVSSAAWHGLVTAVEHTGFFFTALSATKTMYPSAYYTVLRTALLGASQALWVLAPGSRSERQKRALTIAATNTEERRKFVNDLPAATPELRARRDAEAAKELQKLLDIDAAAQQLGYPAGTGSKWRLNATDVIKKAAAVGLEESVRDTPLMFWRMTSGHVHGHAYTRWMQIELDKVQHAADGTMWARATADLDDVGPIAAACLMLTSAAWKLWDERRVDHRTRERFTDMSHFPSTDHDYVQRVSQHPPSSLLPLIAQVSSRLPTKAEWPLDQSGWYRPWALADVAWMSLVRSSVFQHKKATGDDLAEILAQYGALDDPIRHLPVGERLQGYLLRIAGQQFTWQEDDFPEVARSIALLSQTQPSKPLEVLTEGWEQDLLGHSLSDHVALGQLLFTAAINRQGRFDLAWVPEDELAVFDDLTTHPALEGAVERHFATSAAGEKERLQRGLISADPLLRRYNPNPLRARPLVRGYGCDYLIPVTPAVLGKVSPMGLYYTGQEHYKKRDDEGKTFLAFTRDLGELFEQYVGRNLRLLPDAKVHPEIVYGKDGEKTTDWIVVLPNLILLVEAKAFRPTAGLRLGPQETFEKELNQKLGKAIGKQIPTTADLIRKRHPRLAHLPGNLPMFGIVVTMEPYHLVNTPWFRAELPATDVPTVVASCSELEDAVVAPGPGLEAGILAHIEQPPPDGWSLRSLAGERTAINPILAQAWEALAWGAPSAAAAS
ncbi:hypothetical protein [Streptomyces sp. NPDC051546]|uniref:hypothetical protein n=1 Tax=Streptomyces sp. NPDC051546 TaxID=3365655 RepID=UPI0037BB05C2